LQKAIKNSVDDESRANFKREIKERKTKERRKKDERRKPKPKKPRTGDEDTFI
jgi:hypothetical protein